MPPPPLPSSSSTGVDATENAASSEPPEKLSLRALDRGPATREEDLERGPLLLGLSEDFLWMNIPTITDGELDIRELEMPATSYAPILPSRFVVSEPTGLGQAMLQSEPSDAGASFSVPTDGMSSVHIPENPRVGDLAAQLAQLHSDDERGLFSWHYQFEWQNSNLQFSGEPFYSDEGARLCLSGASSVMTVASETPVESQVHLLREEHGCNTSPGIESLQPFNGFFVLGVGAQLGELAEFEEYEEHLCLEKLKISEEEIADMAELLFDDYIRSYAPQRSKQGKRPIPKRTTRRSVNRSAASPKAGKSSAGAANRPGKRNIINGDGEDDGNNDDDVGGGGDGFYINDPGRDDTSQTGGMVACPILVRKLSLGNTIRLTEVVKCAKMLRSIPNLKEHLKKAHYDEYCGSCYKIFDKGGVGLADHGNCTIQRPMPENLISYEKRKAITAYRMKPKNTVKQWEHIYGILYPMQPMCSTPYLNAVFVSIFKSAREYLVFQGARIILQAMEEKCIGTEHYFPLCKYVGERFMDDFILRTIDQAMLQGMVEDGSIVQPAEVASEVDQMQPIQGLDKEPSTVQPAEVAPVVDTMQLNQEFNQEPRPEPMQEGPYKQTNQDLMGMRCQTYFVDVAMPEIENTLGDGGPQFAELQENLTTGDVQPSFLESQGYMDNWDDSGDDGLDIFKMR